MNTKRKIILAFVTIALFAIVTLALTACADTEESTPELVAGVLVSAEGFELDDSQETPRLYQEVSNSVELIDLSDKITVPKGCTWKLFQDFVGNAELSFKIAELDVGNNTFCIGVFLPNGDYKKIQVDIYRLHLYEYTFVYNDTRNGGTIEEKSTVLAPTDTERAGYTFNGWTLEGLTDFVGFPYQVNDNVVFVAKYTPIQYNIVYHLDNGQNGESNPTSYNIQDTIDLHNATKLYYTFMGWYTDKSFKNQLTSITPGMYGNIDLYAKWQYGTEGLVYTLNSALNEYAVTGYRGDLATVIIPSTWNELPVHSIGAAAFKDCSFLTRIYIPQIVTSIGGNAFYGCSNLQTVTFEDNSQLSSIGVYAFYNCSSLTSITIPSKVTELNARAFYECNCLSAVYITDLRAWCNINFGDAYSNPLYYGAEIYCNNQPITDFKVPSGVAIIKWFAFVGSRLTSIIIPESVAYIFADAFNNCSSLKTVFYGGTAEQWSQVSIGDRNTEFTDATLYYYSEQNPYDNGTAVDGENYWHYDTDGMPTPWFKED